MHASSSFLLALALSAAWPAHAAGFSDATVNPADYTQWVLHADPSVTRSVSAITDANPGDGLQITYLNAGAPVLMNSVTGFVRTDFSWDPALQGALQSVQFSNDRYVDGGDDYLNLNLFTYSRALVVQGGQAYVALLPDAGQLRKAWFTTQGLLQAGSFEAFDFDTGLTDPSLHPDFSAGGGVLQFGFANRLMLDTNGNPYALNAVFRYDNIAIDLQAAPVPEPAAALLMLAGVVLLLGRRLQAG